MFVVMVMVQPVRRGGGILWACGWVILGVMVECRIVYLPVLWWRRTSSGVTEEDKFLEALRWKVGVVGLVIGKVCEIVMESLKNDLVFCSL